ncbi:MAG: MBL fold metallo-hydrolase [Cyanobacteriota bacterium]|nr:MBL fold metallo-hydrolase [Cyanobacteriota bacterium]
MGRSPSELTLICLTHYHSDHVGAAAELKGLTGAKIAAHRAIPTSTSLLTPTCPRCNSTIRLTKESPKPVP